ncbi:cupin domain-containing protein [Streptosporangium sp. KLBMP 9127]|nr:cupin domain-containing protein [Streptosporangium sp. KLBMP 9127]
MPETSPARAVRKIAACDVAPNRRRGGDIRVLLSPTTVGASTGFTGVLTLQAGEYVSEHYHPYSEEFLYVVRGGIEVRVDGERITLDSGEGIMIPIGARHRVTNFTAEPALVVFHLCPLAPRPDLGHVDTEALPHPVEPVPNVGDR